MASTYEKIATTTLASAAASYTFSSIPSTYTDLVLISFVQQSVDGENLACQFNSDTATNYSFTQMAGTGSSALSTRASNSSRINLDWYATSPISTSFGVNITSIQNYANATTYKTLLSRANSLSTFGGSMATVGLWRSTSAITSVKIFLSGTSNLNSGSTFTLYGILKA